MLIISLELLNIEWGQIDPKRNRRVRKTNLNPTVPQNHRPISKLPFISKILEKVVAKQLTTVLTDHNILDKFQSCFH